MQKNWYENFFRGVALDMWRKAVRPEQTRADADFIEKELRLSPGARVLDIPCGNGRHSLELAARGYRTTGIDLSEEFIAEAQASASPCGLDADFRRRDTRFAIPPNDPNYETTGRLRFNNPVKLESLFPHMHLRGKDFEYRAVFPNGETQVLLRVPAYNFNWQLAYKPSEEIVLPAGSRIECTAHFDNSANNKMNPDPAAEVKFGEQSQEEMMVGFMDVAIPANVDPRVFLGGPGRPGAAPAARQ